MLPRPENGRGDGVSTLCDFLSGELERLSRLKGSKSGYARQKGPGHRYLSLFDML